MIAYSRSIRMTEKAVAASNPLVGSSRNSIPGDTISSIAILVLFLSPPDIPRMYSVPTCVLEWDCETDRQTDRHTHTYAHPNVIGLFTSIEKCRF